MTAQKVLPEIVAKITNGCQKAQPKLRDNVVSRGLTVCGARWLWILVMVPQRGGGSKFLRESYGTPRVLLLLKFFFFQFNLMGLILMMRKSQKENLDRRSAHPNPFLSTNEWKRQNNDATNP